MLSNHDEELFQFAEQMLFNPVRPSWRKTFLRGQDVLTSKL